jgi:hypothetical protein
MGGHTSIVGDYRWELCPDHPGANMWGFVPQHQLAAERKIGRYLRSGEVVHHDDEVKLNNDPENLFVMTRSAHQSLHMQRRRERNYGPASRERTERLLQEGGLKHAARSQGVVSDTLRRRFPDLIAPYSRRTPSNAGDPALVALLRVLCPDPTLGFREVTERTGAAHKTIVKMCARHGIPWVRKSKVGEVHRRYRRKTASQSA